MKAVYCLLLLTLSVTALAQSDVSVQVLAFIVGSDGQLTPTTSARPSQVVEYQLIVQNNNATTLPSGTVVVTGPVPDSTAYIQGSATERLEELDVEIVGESQVEALRWTLLYPFEPSESTMLSYRVVVEGGDSSVSSTPSSEINCSDFSSQASAQSYFQAAGGPSNDPHGLDSDNDGIACEHLP